MCMPCSTAHKLLMQTTLHCKSREWKDNSPFGPVSPPGLETYEYQRRRPYQRENVHEKLTEIYVGICHAR